MSRVDSAKEILSSMYSTVNTGIALIAFIYIISRYWKVKAFTEASGRIPEVQNFENRKSKKAYKKAKKREKKIFKERSSKQFWTLLQIGILTVILVSMGFKEFAFPALVIIANASGTRIPSKTPILGGFSHDLDKFWNVMCTSKLHMITDQMGGTDTRLGWKLFYANLFGILSFGLFGKRFDSDPDVLLFKRAKQARKSYRKILVKGYFKILFLALAFSFCLRLVIPGYKLSEKYAQFLPAALFGYVACGLGVKLLLLAVRENPVPRVVAERKESALMKKFSSDVKLSDEWVVTTTAQERIGSKYEREKTPEVAVVSAPTPPASTTAPESGRYG